MELPVKTIQELFEEGWRLFRKHFLLYTEIAAVFIIIMVVFDRSGNVNLSQGVQTFFGIIQIIVSIIVGCLLKGFFVQVVDGSEPSLVLFSNKYKRIPQYAIGTVLYLLKIILGLVLLIVPGVIWAVRHMFTLYLIVDENIKPIDAMKKSAEITKGHFWFLVLFCIIVFVINIIGILLFFFGLLITLPVTWFATASLYKKLLKNTHHAASL